MEMNDLKSGKIYKFIEKFCNENGYKFEGTHSITHHNSPPIDSVDRFIALYILENEPELLKEDISKFTIIEEVNDWYGNIKAANKDFIEEFKLVEDWAYNNYEREWMSNPEALYYIIKVAKEGKEAVLIDSYEDGGYFGAS